MPARSGAPAGCRCSSQRIGGTRRHLYGPPREIQTVVSVVAAGAARFLAIGSAIGFIIGPLGAFVGALGPVAAGGPVSVGMSYWVGEEGPELFMPRRGGQILSHGESMGLVSGSGGGTTNYISIERLDLPSVRDAEGFVAAVQQMMSSGGVAAGRGVS